jgi:hypothetical protein
MSDQGPALPHSRGAIRQGWVERFDRFAACGLSVIAFCHAEGISYRSFYRWKHKLAAAPSAPANDPPRLLPVRLLAQPSPVEVVLPQGIVLRLAAGCDLCFVRSLVNTLGGAPC